MGRKHILKPFVIFDAGDMSGDLTSAPTFVEGTDTVVITLSWSGVSPVGEVFVDGAYYFYQEGEYSEWIPLEFDSSPLSVSGNTGNMDIFINNFPKSAIRVRYVATSGSGDLDGIIAGKVVGA